MDDNRMGRFHIVCYVREFVLQQGGSTLSQPWIAKGSSCGACWYQCKDTPIDNLGKMVFVRATQGHFNTSTLVYDRIHQCLSPHSLRYCHTLTHYTAANYLQSILQYGLVPGGREILLSPFPSHDCRHMKSSRSHAPLGIVLKAATLSLVTDLYGTTCGQITAGEPSTQHSSTTVTFSPDPLTAMANPFSYHAKRMPKGSASLAAVPLWPAARPRCTPRLRRS